MMLDRARHDPVAAGLARPGRALQGEVDGLGSTGREDDLTRLGPEPSGEQLVGLVEGGPGAPAERVGRRWVAECLAEVRQHRRR